MTTEARTQINYKWAVNHAIAEEMRRDPSVILYGEDVAKLGGDFGVTRGLLEEFGEERVRDTPISEQAIVGSAVGLAMTGFRPVIDLGFGGFVCAAFDGIFMKLGGWKQMLNLKALPVVVRVSMGAAGGAGMEHAFCPEAILIHSPGLKVVAPSTAYDAKGLLKSAIRDDSPVMFLEHVALYGKKSPVPAEEYMLPLGKAEVKRSGSDVTIVTYSAMVHKALAAAEKLSQEGIDAEVLDLRTLSPLDEEAMLESVKKTSKVVIAHEAMERGGMGNWIAAIIAEKAFNYLDAPPTRVAGLNMFLPHDTRLESLCIPQEKDIVEAVKSLF